MKKITLTLIAFLLLLVGCSSGPYQNLSVVDVQKKLDQKESFILVYGSPTCTYCAEYKKIMTEVVSEYKVTVYYLEVTSNNYSEVTGFIKSALKQNVEGTPTTFVIVDGVVDLSQSGTLTKSNVERILLDYGYISEIKS